MDFQKFVDGFGMAAAIMSVEKVGEDSWGAIRIEKSNAMYKQIMGPAIRDGMRYDELIPKEHNFEDFCYRCAVKKLHLHAYVDTKSMGVWTDGTYIPMSAEYDTENLCYFIFFFEFTTAPEAERMSNLSAEAAPFVLQTCINLRGSENFLEGLNTVVSDIRERTDSFSTCIFMIDKDKERFAPLCAKYRNDAAKVEDFAPYLTREVVFSWEKMLEGHDAIFVKDDNDLKELEKVNPVWAKSLRGAKVKSVILVPLMQGKKMIGVLFVTNFNVDKFLEIKEFITLTAFFLSAEIANNTMMEQLEYMSNIDILTGIKNRNSMNARVDWHVSHKMYVHTPFGIVFADLNGLKTCNDNYGHEEGDKLLRNAADLLKEVFVGDEIYRAGGDEFVVIVPDCDKADFEKKVEVLRKKSGYGSEVCFAVGTNWTEDADKLRMAMHLADEAMYEDKKKYYEDHPDISRRRGV